MENTNYNRDQVFISFWGKDERNGFLTHLKQKLIDGNVNVFTDDNLTGQPLQNLFTHIRKSKIAIVIFSKNYAESGWCLDELVEIKKCLATEKLNKVIPIFHKVKVSSVKKQSGKFGEKFLALQNSLLAEEASRKKIKRINSRIKRWKKALGTITGMAGLSYDKNSPELAFVEKVVDKVNINLANIAAEEGRNTTPGTSESLEVQSLSYNSEGDNESIDLKPLSRHRRTASFLDHTDQYAPFPFEAVMVQNQAENQQSIDNIYSEKENQVENQRSIDNIVPEKEKLVENQRSTDNNVSGKKKMWPNLPLISALVFGTLFVSYMIRRKRRSKGIWEMNLPLQATERLF